MKKLDINKPLITGVVLGAGSGLANAVIDSDLGHMANNTIRSGSAHKWQRGLEGLTEAGVYAGATLAAYGVTKALVDKCIPVASERTSTAAGITSAVSVAYGLARYTDLLKDAAYNLGVYDHQLANGLETLVSHGMLAALVFAGGSFVYDLCSLVAKGRRNP